MEKVRPLQLVVTNYKNHMDVKTDSVLSLSTQIKPSCFFELEVRKWEHWGKIEIEQIPKDKKEKEQR